MVTWYSHARVLADAGGPGVARCEPASHEHKVTVLMRNGDRVAGLLEDVEGGVAYVRVSQHVQRKMNVGDVALLDFVGGASGLPETELAGGAWPAAPRASP